MNDIYSTEQIDDLLKAIDNAPLSYKNDKLNFRFYNKLTREQHVRSVNKIIAIQDHFAKSFFKTIENTNITLSNIEENTIPFSLLQDATSTVSYTKEYRIENEQLFLNIPQSFINLALSRKEDAPLDKISSYVINKYFFEPYITHFSYDFSGEVTSDEESKEVLSQTLGEATEEEVTPDSTPVIKSKHGDNNLFIVISFNYDIGNNKTIPLYVAISYQACLKLLGEEKYIGELHSPSYYKKENGFAILCSGKLETYQANTIKEGSILKFKTPIDEPIHYYENEVLKSLAICLEPHEKDFYTLQLTDNNVVEEEQDTNTYLVLGITFPLNETLATTKYISLDTRVSSALPLISNGKIIALATPLAIDDCYACKIVKLVNPPICIQSR